MKTLQTGLLIGHILSLFYSEPSQWYLPALHLHHKGLFDGDPAAVDDHTLCVREVPVVGVLKLDGVNHSLAAETDKSRLDTIK